MDAIGGPGSTTMCRTGYRSVFCQKDKSTAAKTHVVQCTIAARLEKSFVSQIAFTTFATFAVFWFFGAKR